MSGRPRTVWLPRLLSGLTLAVSAGLFLLVFLSPLFDNGEARPDGWSRVAAVFARDAVMRRIAVAAALGLTVTACIFFRPSEAAPPTRQKAKRGRPPSHVAGA